MQKRPEKGNAPEVAATGASSVKTQEINQGFNMTDSKAVQVSSQPVFNFGAHSVRVVVREGEPWFVASDVCAALDYKNTSKAVADHLDDDERSNEQLDRSRMGSKSVIINESGLYALVLRSRKPEARKFAKWVTSEVLPAIRKTGVYVGKPFTVNPGDVLTAEEQNTLRLMLKSAVERLPKEKQAGAMVKGWSKLKAHFGVPYREIPRQEFSEAVSIIARHTAEWELVEEEPAGSLNETVSHWVRQIESGNGTPAEVFVPLVEAVNLKLGRPDPERIRLAMAEANRVATAVQEKVFNELLAAPGWRVGRWLLGFDTTREGPKPSVHEIGGDVLIGTTNQLTRYIQDPNFRISKPEVASLAEACLARMGIPFAGVAA